MFIIYAKLHAYYFYDGLSKVYEKNVFFLWKKQHKKQVVTFEVGGWRSCITLTRKLSYPIILSFANCGNAGKFHGVILKIYVGNSNVESDTSLSIGSIELQSTNLKSSWITIDDVHSVYIRDIIASNLYFFCH